MPTAVALAAATLVAGASGVRAQTAAAPASSETVVITGSVIERALAEAPYAVSAIDAESLRSAGPLVNLSEAMARVPGLVVANRGNYAQDLQISSRGFGARAGFGVRGVRLYIDGIPASGPDGQGQVSHADLAAAQRVEVLRGPFSVLYGNSSGGVIAVVAAPVRAPRTELAFDAARFGLRQWRIQGESPLGEGGLSARAGWQSLRIDGWRPHAAAERTLGTLRLAHEQGSDRVVALASRLDQPADDPLGLSREQFDADPLQTTPQALQFNTRKTTRQTQGGLRWQHRFDAGALRESSLALYGGQRDVVQFLAIAPGTQAPARHGGGVIDFARGYGGAEARLRFAWESVDVVVGAAVDRQRDDRRGYENFTGTGAAQQLGVVGRLRREEVNRAASDDGYVQGEWALSRAFTVSGGVRSGRVRLRAEDAFLSNGDDSGQREFRYTNPVLGLRWQAAPGLNVHASVARGFESPTLGELAYRRDGSGGFNTELQPQTSRQAEIGVKWRLGALALDAAIFEARVSDEIGVATNAGGRSAFQNVGRTLRRGGEIAARWDGAGGWSAALTATALNATYRDDFLTCAGVPCTAPTLAVPAGNRIAGTARGNAYAEVAWRSAALGQFAVEVRQAGNTVVNDRNTEAAPGYVVGALRWQHGVRFGAGWRGEWLVRVDNVTDRRYAGSVIVNDANGRFYETASPRSVSVGLRLILD